MNINRRNFLKLAATSGLLFSFGKVHAATNEKILVVYYSRTGEEYGTGFITKGNTAIVAELIAQKTGADIFEIKPVTPYPDSYEECKKIASREKATKARPPFIGDVDISSYDIIFGTETPRRLFTLSLRVTTSAAKKLSRSALRAVAGFQVPTKIFL